MSPKILLISNMYPSKENPSYGIFVKNFIKILSNNFDFKNIVIRGREKSKLKKLLNYVVFSIKIIFYGIFKKYDIIYLHYVTHASLPLLLVSYFTKAKIVLNYHGDDLVRNISFTQKILFYVSKILSNKADLIVVPSDFFKKRVIEILEVEENDIYVYPSSGIDLELFRPLSKAKNKNKFGFNEDDYVVGMVSSIYEAKGWKVFLDAMCELKKDILNLKILIAGRGIEEKELLSYIKKKNLDDIVVFVREKTHSELVEIYNALDIFIFPTMLEESLGLVGLEAMACGVPVVGSNIGGLTDYIKDDYNGYLFEVASSEEMSLKIKQCIGNDKLVQGAVNTALSFSSTKVTGELLDTLKGLKC